MTGGLIPVPAAGLNLDEAVPWGRNRVEYGAFFDLGELAPATRVLDCAGGPSSFTAEMCALGFPVVAADPLYGPTLFSGRPLMLTRFLSLSFDTNVVNPTFEICRLGDS